MRNKKIDFTAKCQIKNIGNYDNFVNFLNDKLNEALKCYKNELSSNCTISNIEVTSANEYKEEFLEGEVCTVCGYNGKCKVINLTDEYVELFCPQCKSKFKVKISEEI